MIVLRFRTSGEHEDLLKKIKKMKKFTEDLEECLEDAMEEDEYSYRSGKKDWEEDEMDMRGSRYSYRRGGHR